MVTKMQTVTLNPEHSLQIGPRQGVHIHPVQWRRTQFRNPSNSYQYRARIEPGSRATEFPSQAASRQTSFAGHRSSASCPAFPVLRGSSTVFPDQRKQTRTEAEAKLSLTAHALVIQPRPPQRPPTAPKTAEIQSQPYSYPDPRKIKGNVSFDVRLLELSKLESETVRSEELKNRLANRARAASSVTLTSQQNPQPQASRGTPYRTSMTGIPDRRPRSATLLGRKSSLPASIGYTYNELRYSREADKLDQPSSSWNVNTSRSFLNTENASSIAHRRPRSAHAGPDPEANVQHKLSSSSSLLVVTAPIAEEEESTTNSDVCLDSNSKESIRLHSAVNVTATLDQGAKASAVLPSNSPTSSSMTHLSASCDSKHECQDSIGFCPGSQELQASKRVVGSVGSDENERSIAEDTIKVEDTENVLEKEEKVEEETEEREDEDEIEKRTSMLDLGTDDSLCQSQEVGFPAELEGKIDGRESDSSASQQKIGQADKQNADGKRTKQRRKQKGGKKLISSSKSATHLDRPTTLKSSDSTSSLRSSCSSKSKKSSRKIVKKHRK